MSFHLVRLVYVYKTDIMISKPGEKPGPTTKFTNTPHVGLE